MTSTAFPCLRDSPRRPTREPGSVFLEQGALQIMLDQLGISNTLTETNKSHLKLTAVDSDEFPFKGFGFACLRTVRFWECNDNNL